MSDYDYDDRPRRRSGRTREPEYVETQETYIHRGSGGGDHDLVLRPRDDDRDDYGDYRRTSVREEYAPRRARSVGRRTRDFYDDDYYSDHGPSTRGRRRQSRYDDYEDDRYSDKPRNRERRKSKVGEVLEDLGLGGVAGAVTKIVRGSRSRSRHRRGSDSDRDRSRSRNGGRRHSSRENRKRWQQAAQAALITGAVEAFRSRNEPGGLTGAKGQRIATAALGAAGIDGFLDRDPDEKNKRHILESVVGGMAATRLANGPREGSDSRGRSRSRSRSVVGRLRSKSASIFRGRSSSRGRGGGGGAGSTVKDLAAAGGVAAIGKAIYDRVRSKSRGRVRRDRSASSDDSYVPSRQQRYQPDRGYPSDSMNDEDTNRSRGRPDNRDDGEANRGRSSSESTVSTTDLNKQRRKTRTKELLTAGFATVATIHAGHGVYTSMVESDKRHKLVMEGEMSPEESRKLKAKNRLQDAAAIGIAALGLKSAFAEWKEMNEQRHEKHVLEARRRKRRKMRERRERDMRMKALTGGNPWDQQGGAAAQYYDSNPYQSYGSLPPPPVGAPPPNRYP